MDAGSIVIAKYMGISLGLGQLLTIITQLFKTADKVPVLDKIPGFQWLTDQITKGNPVQVRTFVGIFAAIINIAWTYQQTGEAINAMAIMSTIGTYVSALGGYDLWFSGDKKDK